MKTHRGDLHFEGGEERERRDDRKPDKRRYRKSVLLWFERSKNMSPQTSFHLLFHGTLENKKSFPSTAVSQIMSHYTTCCTQV